MRNPFPPDPEDSRRRLSAREQAALRRIEDALARDDPGFTHRMRRVDDHVTVVLPRRRRTQVVAAVVAVVLLLVVVPPSWWVLALLLGLMGLATWVLVRGPGSAGPDDPDR